VPICLKGAEVHRLKQESEVKMQDLKLCQRVCCFLQVPVYMYLKHLVWPKDKPM